MRGTKAKRIRREVYGPGVFTRTLYYIRKKLGFKDGETVFADPKRHEYQQRKKER